ncbi:arginine biosynthesis bifunctional protein ArgJ [Aliidongia dinghuensis]|uniref:Arginine biosynthesis bifunctional protein ArgJ n=1 Tax=Aliidongia dinghuensis TaxID=1867774 RepID=A0A8J2YQ82_9PROT|nr:bifunctional glutamate N-acetyltransferase/amino-acid acetyltransferase ArgJ [Aliidongia dinghuensis]GGF01106.1 arginine biosynthesis bifunctional protein ArgJ [Aliidongia dinghuensis]
MPNAVSPLAPTQFPELKPIAGVRLAAGSAGIRYKGRTDLMVALLDPGSTIAGVFTRSKTPGAPVVWCREVLPHGKARVIVVNSGNSNVFTGKAGRKIVEDTAAAAAKAAGCKPEEVYISSTGVIGEVPPGEKIVAALPDLVAAVKEDHWAEAAKAIMTTDTFPKGATATAEIDGVTVTINGFVKGSGMIAPDMATMLGYVFTDAKLPADVLQELLSSGTNKSFNATTVDGDTSTSDTVLLAATHKAKHDKVTKANDPRLKDFKRKLEALLIDLAQQIVRDGEGAEKFVEIRVTGADSKKAAHRIGLAIGNSPLVKTALAAGDANWGRIVMAVGKCGEKVDRDRLKISVGGTVIASEGGPVPGYDEAPVAKHMAGREIVIEVDIGLGKGKATVWTCDLTHRYIDINGSYRS